ncbi:MAG: M15 family metallopeptidase, partial [Candidatus Zambryskibacteria bacterium]|nr:M15 family metallopeptidase [Candidatus Zambryskibacteria bacterium]
YAMAFIMFAVVVFIGYGSYNYYLQNTTLKYTKEQLASTTEIFQKNIQLLRSALLVKNNENTNLYSLLTEEQIRNNLFDEQIQSLSSTVGLLDKLSKTDRELLQKYSSVYFLNENYLPSQLAEIDTTFLYKKTKPETIHVNIKSHLEDLLRAANADSMPLLVLSAYRSFGTQISLKASYKITYGTTAANKFSADQGYSEHQLGSAVDFTTNTIGDTLTGFEKTKSYTWLTQNAYKYGFILSYPLGNKYYQFEPWHWRFVGVELATKLHTDGKYFYDMDQREINNYLVKIFD